MAGDLISFVFAEIGGARAEFELIERGDVCHVCGIGCEPVEECKGGY